MGSLLFLIKVSFSLVAFYLPYRLVFRYTTFFSLNRFYLLAGLVLSFTIPALRLPGPISTFEYAPLVADFTEPIELRADKFLLNTEWPGTTVDFSLAAVAVYFAGLTWFGVRLGLSIRRILRLRKGVVSTQDGQASILRVHTAEAFSFMNLIFIPADGTDPEVLQHEKAHITQRHWVDLWLVEAACLVLWFNPFARWYREAIRQQHEFLADRQVIRSGIPLQQYLECMAHNFGVFADWAPVSNFSFQFIKQRIHMLTEKKSASMHLVRYLVAVPAVAILLFAFSVDDEQKTLDFSSPIASPNSTLSDGFGERIHPRTGKKQMHTGLDFVAKQGVSVQAVEAGTVTFSNLDSLRGNFVVISHNDMLSTTYSHLQAPLVKKGDQIKKGQKIGEVGDTGATIKSHLHFEVIKNGIAVDPMTFLPGNN